MNLDSFRDVMRRAGVQRLYFKRLATNDNSKQQVYLGPDFSALNVLPTTNLRAEGTSPDDKPRFKAALRFGWLQSNGTVMPAPGAQLILYPQYPEVRFSGFLQGSRGSPSDLMRSRQQDRILFFGVCGDGRVVGHVVGPDDPLAREANGTTAVGRFGVFTEMELAAGTHDPRAEILDALRAVHHKGWIASKKLHRDGTASPYRAQNAGGYTLEAELGIVPNGVSEPDYKGWEVKQYAIKTLESLAAGKVTLMDPQPKWGPTGTDQLADFLRKHGYPDKSIPDRLNYSATHRAAARNAKSGLTLTIRGMDASTGKIVDAGGGIDLLDDAGNKAASWHFTELIAHWARKHARAAYIPSVKRDNGTREYHYAGRVQLGVGTSFEQFLAALTSGVVFYDPGLKLERTESGGQRAKSRNPFRISTSRLAGLYETLEDVVL